MTHKISSAVNILIGAFLLIAVNSFLRPCHGMMAMPCEFSAGIACAVLAVMTAVNLVSLLIRRKEVRLASSLLSILSGAALILTPRFGRCQVANMACNLKTFPALKLGGIFVIVFTAVFAAAGIIRDHARSSRHVHTR